MHTVIRAGELRRSRGGTITFEGEPHGSSDSALFSSLTVRENVALPLREHTRLSAVRIAEIADLKIALAGLPAA